MDNPNYRFRILEDLVSLEAWYKPLEVDQTSPFHVALAFGDARYFGGEDTPVDFRVKLARATLVVICDPALTVPKRTKVREYPEWNKTVKSKTEESASQTDSETENDARELRANPVTGVSGSKVGSKANASSAVSGAANEMEVTEVISQHVRMNYRDVGGEHHWDCRPISSDSLQGKAHDGKELLMELKPGLAQSVQDLGVRVYVKCKAEDIEISDINAKPSLVERIKGQNLDRRLSLAKEVIKQKLAEASLDVVDLDASFADVIIADILAIPE